MLIGRCCRCGATTPSSSQSSSSQSGSSVQPPYYDGNCSVLCEGKSDQYTISWPGRAHFDIPWASSIPLELDSLCNVQVSGGLNKIHGSYGVVYEFFNGVGWEVVPWYLLGIVCSNSNYRLRCFVCQSPTDDPVFSGDIVTSNPTLIYCGGNPNGESWKCSGSNCAPSAMVGDITAADTASGIGAGSITLQRRYTDPSFLSTAKAATGWDTLFDTWKTNPNSRNWQYCDYMLLGDRGSIGEGWATINPGQVQGVSPFTSTDLALGAGTVLGMPGGCGFFAMLEHMGYTIWAYQDFSSIGEFGATKIQAIKDEMFSSDVLEAYKGIVELAGYTISAGSNSTNPARWRWFGSYAERTVVFDPVTLSIHYTPFVFDDFTSSRWDRNSRFLKARMVRINRGTSSNNGPRTCEEYNAGTQWQGDNLPLRNAIRVNYSKNCPVWCNSCMTEAQSFEDDAYIYENDLSNMMVTIGPRIPAVAPQLQRYGQELQYAWNGVGRMPVSLEWP